MTGDRAAPAAVIDTNVWLDLFLFHDAQAQNLAQALQRGALRAVVNEGTQAELRAVLARPHLRARLAEQELEASLQAWCAQAASVAVTGTAPWRCRDADDQKFLDLAYAAGAAYLFTKDRALLALARKAHRAGLQIRAPRDFAPGPATV